MHEEFGEYSEKDAAADFARYLHGQSTDNLLELTYTDRRRVHNLKYFTWVEQQGKTYEEIQAQWYDPITGPSFQGQVDEIDALIEEFNDCNNKQDLTCICFIITSCDSYDSGVIGLRAARMNRENG
jgi:hypothetical protein